MRPIRPVVTLCIILLGTLSLLSLAVQQQVVSQTKSYTQTYAYTVPSTVRAQLPSLDVMKRFVTTLIDSYTTLVDQNDKTRKDFDAIKGYFTLYHDNSSSFNVTVIQTQSYYTDYLTLIFNPIEATQPHVTINQTETFLKLFPNASLTFGFDYYIQKDFVATEYNGNIVRLYAIMNMPLSAFSPSSDYVTDANQIAKSMYSQDQSQVPTVSQTQTTTQTSIISQEQTTGTQPNQTYIWPVIYAAIAIGIGILVMYFGSLKDFVKFLTDEQERKDVIEDLKRLLQLRLGRNKNQNQLNVSEAEKQKPEAVKSRLPPNADAIIALLNPFLVRWQAKEILGMKPSRWSGVDTEDRIDLQKSARSLSDKLLQLEANYEDIWDWGLMQSIRNISEELRKFGIAQPVVSGTGLDFTQLELHGRGAFEATRAIVGWLKQVKKEDEAKNQ